MRARVTIYSDPDAPSGDILKTLLEPRYRRLSDSQLAVLTALSDGHLHKLNSSLPGMICDPNLSVRDQLRLMWSHFVLIANGLVEVVDEDWDRITTKGRGALKRGARPI